MEVVAVKIGPRCERCWRKAEDPRFVSVAGESRRMINCWGCVADRRAAGQQVTVGESARK